MKTNNKKTSKRFNSSNADKFLDYGVDVDNRIVNIVGDIEAENISIYTNGILLMLSKNKSDDIHIYINSFGGDPYTSFGFYNFLRSITTCNINTYNIGCAMSGASIIFLAGDHRYMYEDTVFMVHSVSSKANGKVYLDLEEETEECKQIHKQLCKIYARHTKLSAKQWDNMIKYKNRYYRAADALDIGFVHKLLVDNDDKEV